MPLPPACWDRVSHAKDPGTEDIHHALAPWPNPVAACGEYLRVGFLNRAAWCRRLPRGGRRRVAVPSSWEQIVSRASFSAQEKAGSSARGRTSALAGEERPRWAVLAPSSLAFASLCPTPSPPFAATSHLYIYIFKFFKALFEFFQPL